MSNYAQQQINQTEGRERYRITQRKQTADKLAQPPNLQALLSLPLNERAYALIDALTQSGFDIAKCIRDQITIICGNQRGGKVTLMAILAILSKALEPQTKIHYFTAGDDCYPFKCSSLLCRLNYPNLDGSEADARGRYCN